MGAASHQRNRQGFRFFLRGCLTACTILLLLQLQDGVIEEEEFLAIVGQVLKVRSMVVLAQLDLLKVGMANNVSPMDLRIGNPYYFIDSASPK